MSGTRAFERSARSWMHAYPRRWRDLHGDALLGVLEEAHEDADRNLPKRLPRAEVVGLLRAGWGLRWREHPPFWRWVGYRMLDLRMPAVYWFWVVDDIRAPIYPLLRVVGTQVVYWATLLVFSLVSGEWLSFSNPVFWAVYPVIVGSLTVFLRGQFRSKAWSRHIVDGHVPESIRAQTT